ncbi:uncharacterized protein LOC131151488 [Malania oleifera]|uniref:uncharacterized protein LOC131151488 n=1 Tax=Malania oleifera TaxID=397392 RepID=UPI0025AE433B|nr:uncharacterized protein LOC131151488 [Malania oleifera]
MVFSSEFVVVTTLDTLGSGNSSLISINASSQLSLKLTPSNFPSWRAQLTSLLISYDLQGYLDSTIVCLPRTLSPSTSSTNSSSTSVSNPAFWHWLRQDKLILHAILASISEPVMLLIEELTLIQRESRSVSEYLHAIKELVDELAVIDSPVSADDITLYVLNDLGLESREIAVPIRAHETSLTFEELHDMLVGHESYLRRVDVSNVVLVVTANSTQRRTLISTFNRNQRSSSGSSC